MAINEEIPKSRITLTYRTAVNGEKKDVQLPLRLLMMGDFSNGTSKDREVDLDRRELRNLDGTNLREVMEDMDMSVQLRVPNRINGEAQEEIDVELPVTAMDSFSPAAIAEGIPKVKALLLVRKLLLEVQGNLDNRKEFRKLLRALASDSEAVAKLMSELPGFDDFKIPERKDSTGAADTPATPDAPPAAKPATPSEEN
ncbi:MAG: type VI secretion system contractile sheath small subunit [Myxococcota bacterium]